MEKRKAPVMFNVKGIFLKNIGKGHFGDFCEKKRLRKKDEDQAFPQEEDWCKKSKRVVMGV